MSSRALAHVAAPGAELRRQAENLLARGYPALAGLTVEAFEELVAALEETAVALGESGEEGRIPLVLVVPVPADRAITHVRLGAKPGFTSMEAADLARFEPIESVSLPAGAAYLLADVDTGRATLNVTPDDALETIAADDRSPLTLAEGLALVTHFPEVLRTHNAFSLLGSRCGDRRVTAIWVSKGAPRLGWCWAGNPHTWLGSASCARRIG